MKTIMILGGGYYQLPLIKKSVELGYNTIVCGIAGNYPGYKYATKWVNVDTFDKEAVLRIAQEEHIDGILLCGSDACMPTIGYVCDRMNLFGPSEQATINASNKAIMKQLFIRYGVRTAQYQKISSLVEAYSFAEIHNFPVVLKVVDSSGSKGVAIVHDKQELKKQYSKIIKETKQPYIIIEEFVAGEEFGAQAFVRNGKLTFVMPHGDIVFHSATDVPIGHYAPYEKSEELLDDIIGQLQLCIEALEIDNTAINADFILSGGKVYVLEIGARAGATCLPELVSNYYGTDYYEYLLHLCVGESDSVSSSSTMPSLVKTLISKRTGVVESINVSHMPKEVVSIDVYPHIGETVNAFRNAYDRIGTIIMKGSSVEILKRISQNISELILNIR